MNGTGRRASRRTALFLLYQWDLTGQPLASLYEGTPDEFATSLAGAVSERAEALDRRITETSDEWPADRLGTLERNVLRIGVYELEEGTVPREVAINEAVVLAKRYASEDAAKLVNGILAKVAREGGRLNSVDDALARAEELLAQLNARRDELEKLAEAEDLDADAAVESIAELAELAKQIEAELTRARTLADAGAPGADAGP